MALIHVPRPKNAYNPDRPMGSLLKAQVDHLRQAESRLPLRYGHQIDTYIKAIKTEGEAANYIRKVTEAMKRVSMEVVDEGAWKRFDNSGRLFWNMNTPAEYEEARRILESEAQ